MVLGHFGDNRNLWNRSISRATESCVYHSPCAVFRISVTVHICVQVSMSNSRRKYGAIPNIPICRLPDSGCLWLRLLVDGTQSRRLGHQHSLMKAPASPIASLQNPTTGLTQFERCLPSNRFGRRKLLVCCGSIAERATLTFAEERTRLLPPHSSKIQRQAEHTGGPPFQEPFRMAQVSLVSRPLWDYLDDRFPDVTRSHSEKLGTPYSPLSGALCSSHKL